MQKSLETERLILRSLAVSDAENIVRLRSDGRVNKYLNRSNNFSIEQSTVFIERILRNCEEGISLYWALERKEEPGLMGTICIWNISEDRRSAEIGYELMPCWQKKGYMQEALKAVMGYCTRKTTLSELHAYTHSENAVSSRLLENHQFRFEGRKEMDGSEMLYYKLNLHEQGVR